MTFRKLFQPAGVLLSLCFCNLAAALNPVQMVSHYLRDSWSTDYVFPGGQVSSIAQTMDGCLWIGGERGLVRFDGRSFNLLLESSKGIPLTHILGLTTDAEGGLWVWMQGANVLRLYEGKFQNVTSKSILPDGYVTAMAQTLDGGVLLSTVGQETFEYRKGRMQKVATVLVPGSLILTNAKTSDGKIWLGTSDNGLFYLQAGQIKRLLAGFDAKKVNTLVAGPRNGLWIGTDDGLFYWDGEQISDAAVPPSLRDQPILTITYDRGGGLWAGTPHGLFKFDIRSNSSFKTSSTLSSLVPSALFQDREGDVWIGSSQGIERWREGVFNSYSSMSDFPPGNSGPIFADADDRLWFGPVSGGLASLADGRVVKTTIARLSSDIVYSIAGSDQDLWVGRQRGGLTHIVHRGSTLSSKTYTRADGLAQNSVYVVEQAKDGAVWAGTVSAGLSRLKGGTFTNYTTANGLASNTITAIEEDSLRHLWVATPGGVSVLTGDAWRTYGLADGLPTDEITALLRDDSGEGNGMWIGTANGLALFSSNRIQSFQRVPEVLHEPVLGLAKDSAGFLWVATQEHTIRLNPARLLSGTVGMNDIRKYDRADGLLSSQGTRRSRSMLQDHNGRIWFSTRVGLAATDPAALARPPVPVLVQIRTLLADGHNISLQEPKVPASQRKVTLGFSGVSLPVPERVQYRYRLDGFDNEWSEATATPEAVYTNLEPGNYRFHVVASNSEGLWNVSDVSLPFVIEPALWQTWWFRIALGVLFLLAMRWVYLFRMRQLAKVLHLRFEERLAERTRIAQDLHDTLLQGFLSASLQLDVASEFVPRESPAAPMLTRVLALMRQVADECRNSLVDLRTVSRPHHNLEEGLSSVPQELSLDNRVSYRVITNGSPRAVDPLCSDELFLIGREAVVNAYRHADATRIEVEFVYKRTGLHFFVRDDGRGIEETVLLSGKERHWGLTGMRERATRLGAQLRFWSRPAKGTEIEVIVPGHIAYLQDKQSGKSVRRALLSFKHKVFHKRAKGAL